MTTDLAPTDTPDALKDAIRRAVDLLAAGEIVALPTETVYGLAADATNPDAVAKVFKAKSRPAFDPLIVHLPDRNRLKDVAILPPEIESAVNQVTQQFWPGPLTLVLPKTPLIPDIVTSGLDTIAVRVSANPVFEKIVRALDRPIAAPSANRFGRLSPTSARAVLAELGGLIPLVVDGGGCHEGLESTILRIEPPEKTKPLFHILRPGPVTPDDLKPIGKIVKRKQPATSSKETPQVPGQLPSHYAPSTPLRLFERPEDFQPDPDKRYGLLSFRGEPKDGWLDRHDWDRIEILSPGAGKMPEAAVRFFFVLRSMDEAGLDEIVAEPIAERGLGIAMMDRLRRAAAPTAESPS